MFEKNLFYFFPFLSLSLSLFLKFWFRAWYLCSPISVVQFSTMFNCWYFLALEKRISYLMVVLSSRYTDEGGSGWIFYNRYLHKPNFMLIPMKSLFTNYLLVKKALCNKLRTSLQFSRMLHIFKRFSFFSGNTNLSLSLQSIKKIRFYLESNPGSPMCKLSVMLIPSFSPRK